MRITRLHITVLLACVAAMGAGGCRSAQRAPTERQMLAAIDRGVAFLVHNQNADGSWGNARGTKDLNIYAPVPGAHLGFRAATTALCVAALVEVQPADAAALSALDRGEQWLLANLPRVRRAEATAIYNVWAHAYGITALARMHERHTGDAARQAAIRQEIAGQIDRLRRYEFVGGGWGYYDFQHHLQQPGGSANSFTTATVMLALHDARRVGVDVPQPMVTRGLGVIRRQRKPDFTYLYGEHFHYHPGREVNRPGGSLGRSQTCNAALRTWGDEAVTDAVIDEWLTRLADRNGWLDIGRKRPIPHESYFQVAGYFFYYGHYYAARCIDLLPAEARPRHQQSLARIIAALQEADGSWWDYPLYSYHQPYGTAYALLTLRRCLPPTSAAAAAPVAIGERS